MSVSIGAENIMAIDINRKLYSWGKGDFGGLGHGDSRHVISP